MSKNSITQKAFKRYHAYNSKYFPLKVLQIIFDNSSPYFNLWMSSEIITALYENCTRKEIYTLVAITLFGNLFVRMIGAILSRTVSVQLELLSNNEALAFQKKTMSLDYDKMENPEIQLHRRKIVENSYISGYGVTFMRDKIELLLSYIINIIFSFALFLEMLVLMLQVGITWFTILFLLILVVCIVCNVMFQLRYSKNIAEYDKKIGDYMLTENRMSAGENVNGMDSRIYKQQKIVSKLSEKMNQMHLTIFSESANAQVIGTIPSMIFEKLSEVSSYLLICQYCTLGVFPVGSIIKYIGCLWKFTHNIGMILFVIKNFQTNEPYLQVYLDYFDIKNDMYQGSLSVEKRSDKKFDIEFRNVSFQYVGCKEYALKNINLTLKVGERLAVVGMNGSGKTTFIKLLCRLYDPSEGEIFMNDFNIRKYDYKQYLSIFSVVFQDYNLLSVPLGNNIASAGTWDTKKAERLLEEVGFGERYAQMPKKLETPLYKDFDEDGVNVSGGEAQKIALARALYKDAPFIILDEPTAALDPIAEAEIYSKFDSIVEDKTAIYISHRLSSCRFCDKIAVFDKGEIVQVGTHEELLADVNGKYYELWNAQAQYYTEKSA